MERYYLYDATGVYTFTTTNASGCDSTATLNLTINNATSSTTDVTACDSYIGTALHTATGSYTFTTTNASGCDSTATLNLTINNANINVVASSTSLCFGDTSIGSATIGLDSYEWYSINQLR